MITKNRYNAGKSFKKWTLYLEAGRLIRHFLNTFEPDITVKRFRKRYKELQKDLREDVPHKVLYSSRGTRYYWLQENVLSFLRNRINIKAEVK